MKPLYLKGNKQNSNIISRCVVLTTDQEAWGSNPFGCTGNGHD